ncbi:hypothetical protein SUGI_0670840 [Cryptomeria japonica]|nr:hypothetical protein SUGI_0670840 [Cryptomeria japonica]
MKGNFNQQCEHQHHLKGFLTPSPYLNREEFALILELLASSSSSHLQDQKFNAFYGIESAGERRKVSESPTLFDVFINHRGPDVKFTLATHLYDSLDQVGIKAFLDSEEKELGNSFPSTIETAIRSAKVHIAIFSKRYAEAPWCLAELLLMLQSHAKIIPVFYQVKPSDLRHIETGPYAEAFFNYKEKGRYLDILSAWKEALQSVSLIAGEEPNSDLGLNKLVEDFEKRCLDKLVQEFENQCGQDEGNHQAKVIDIFGMGGSGKTTLAKELFNRKKSNYTTASFLFDVREASVNSELPSLQSKLLKDLFGKEISFRRKDEGTSSLKDHLSRTPNLSSLIVVDDIDHVEQLNALLVTDFLNKSSDSLVIVTTRDVGVLITAGITVGYNLKGMDRNDALELFYWHAFRQSYPFSGYEVLVDSFIEVCVGLPLSLQVLGRHVHGRHHRFWESELIKARTMLPQDVKQILKIIFDALDGEEKQVFMDIACFFLGKQTSRAERVLEGSGWNVHNTTEKGEMASPDNEGPVFKMHDHLRDLGREMALELSPPHRLWRPKDLRILIEVRKMALELSPPHRLWRPIDLRILIEVRKMALELSPPYRLWRPKDLRILKSELVLCMKESMGFKNILAKTDIRCFYSFFDESMGSLVKFLLGQPDTCFQTSGSLLWLHFECISKEQRRFPTWIPLQNLQYLKINCSGLKTLWENDTQAPCQLKELHICHSFGAAPQFNTSECSAVEELRLERLNVLEKMCIQNCYSLRSVSGISNHLRSVSGISNHSTLIELEIINCSNRRFENLSLSGMRCLERITFRGKVALKYFRLDGCPKLNTIEGLSPKLPTIEEFSPKLNMVEGVSCNNLVELSIRDRPELEKLSVTDHRFLESIIIDGCEKLNFELGDCKKLKNVSGKCPEFESLTSSAILGGLKHLQIYSSENLQIIMLPTTLISVSVKSCRDLQRVEGIDDRPKLAKLIIKECPELEELPSLAGLKEIKIKHCEKIQNIRLPTTLTRLFVKSCRGLQRVEGISDFPKLAKLIIKECPELEELPNLSKASFMEKIEINNCEKLQNIMLPTTLIHLSLKSCRNLQRVEGIGDFPNLAKLIIKECPKLKLEELPFLAGVSCLEDFKMWCCQQH